MADNVDITPGTGTTISTEEVTTLNGGSVSAQHAQRVIPAVRTADGTANDGVGPHHEAAGSATLDALNEALTVSNTAGIATVVFTTTLSSFIGELIFEGHDGSGWVTLPGIVSGGLFKNANVVYSGSTSGTSKVMAPVVGHTQIRMRISAFTSGSMAVIATTSGQDANYGTPLAAWDSGFTFLDNPTTDGAGALLVGGNIAHNETDAGNPVKIGGKANSGTPTSVANGDRVDAWYDPRGAAFITTSDVLGVDITANGTPTINVTAQGDVIHGAGDSGEPVKIGGRAQTSLPTAVDNNDRVDALFNGAGGLVVSQIAGTGTAGSDGVNVASLIQPAGTAVQNPIPSAGWYYNGTTWDRVRGGTNGAQVVGAAAHASPTAGNPVFVAGRASAVIPTDVGADGDAAGLWTNRNGATVVLMAPHVGLNGDPWSLVHETAQYTTTQTSTVLVTGGASEKIVVTKVQIQAGGTTAGTLQLYFGTGAYSRGTSRAIFDGEFAPSATSKPGVIMDGPFIAGTNGDDLMVTDSAAINPLTITVWYYVIT